VYAMKKFDTVLIDWYDSCADITPWIHIDDFDYKVHEEYMIHHTKGFFVHKSKIATYVCQSIQKEGCKLGGIFSIPNGCIIKVTKI
jgi:hypothetical protein